MERKTFLDLLRAVEAYRAAVRQENMVITDEEIADAGRIDALEAEHKKEMGQAECVPFACPQCVQLAHETAMLRERLRLQGVELAVNVL